MKARDLSEHLFLSILLLVWGMVMAPHITREFQTIRDTYALFGSSDPEEARLKIELGLSGENYYAQHSGYLRQNGLYE